MSPQHCCYCQNQLHSCRIKCSECADVTLCVQCFYYGAENGAHRRDHSYIVLNEDSFTTFTGRNAWKVTEEEALLDAIDLCSFGNWEGIAEQVKHRSPEATLSNDQPSVKRISDHTIAEKVSAGTTIHTVELSTSEQQELGYISLRDEFEREYDNDAELSIGNLSWNHEDDDLDIAYTLFQLDMYRRRLKEREPRKRLAKEYGIIQNATTAGSKKLQAIKAKQSKDEREFREKLRAFARFQRFAEHEKMNVSLTKEKQAKNRIKELVKYRRNGIKKISECAVYEDDRIQREKKKEMKRKLASMPATGKPGQAASKKDRNGTIDGSPASYTSGLPSTKLYQLLPGYELLSEREKRLCVSLGLKPAAYITIKTCILRECLQRRQGGTNKIRYPSQLDRARRQRILAFFTSNGWISGVS